MPNLHPHPLTRYMLLDIIFVCDTHVHLLSVFRLSEAHGLS
jgi:hypothetical protein